MTRRRAKRDQSVYHLWHHGFGLARQWGLHRAGAHVYLRCGIRALSGYSNLHYWETDTLHADEARINQRSRDPRPVWAIHTDGDVALMRSGVLGARGMPQDAAGGA